MGSVVNGILGQGGRNPQQVEIDRPSTVAQANEQYGNVQQGLTQQQQFLNALAAQNGIQNQSNVYNQLQGVAQGTGPNPAQAALNQATQANIANQAAMMAGQRGSSANPALIARQAAMQGANTQQQAVGQGATLQAQQQLNALGQLGQMSGQQVAQQQAAQNAYNTQALGAQGNVLQGINNQNNAAVGMQSNWNNNQTSQANAQTGLMGDIFKGVTGAIGKGASLFGPAAKTATSNSAVGGSSELGPNMMMAAEGGQVKAPKSFVGRHFHRLAQGGEVEALVSPGEKYLSPQAVEAVKQGASPLKEGATIPGKPKVSGAKNSYANDTVPATLEEGGIVLPRSVTQAKDPAKKAAEFVAAVLKKQALKKG
jgi:hypothetical protein